MVTTTSVCYYGNLSTATAARVCTDALTEIPCRYGATLHITAPNGHSSGVRVYFRRVATVVVMVMVVVMMVMMVMMMMMVMVMMPMLVMIVMMVMMMMMMMMVMVMMLMTMMMMILTVKQVSH